MPEFKFGPDDINALLTFIDSLAPQSERDGSANDKGGARCASRASSLGFRLASRALFPVHVRTLVAPPLPDATRQRPRGRSHSAASERASQPVADAGRFIPRLHANNEECERRV
jgi:hypothetical protein